MGRSAIIGAVRFFNTAGPVRAEKHYAIPPLSRMDLDGILTLVRQEKYFVLHAPRQTGKTSALLALRDLLHSSADGGFRCVYANLEAAQAAREDVGSAVPVVLGELAGRARRAGDGFLGGAWRSILEEVGPYAALGEALTRWSEADSRPLVLLLDEIDALVGDSLLSVLRQLRAGYDERPAAFPQSVVLCGLRDVGDYRMESESGKRVIARGSPFNIVAKSLRLGDFTEEETCALLAQHTAETGQEFLPRAVKTVWEQTRGQPWLVNALAYEACFESESGRDRSRPIGAEDILTAREALIRRRNTHIHQLGEKLREDRVRRVVEPLLSDSEMPTPSSRDLGYARDLGLIAADDPVRMANPIYREVAPRELTYAVQATLAQEAAWYATRERGSGCGEAVGSVSGVLPGAFGALGGALRVSGGRAATAAAGVLAAGGEQRGPRRAGVWSGARANGPAAALASGWGLGEVRGGVQDPAAEPGADGAGGAIADGGVHGPVRCGVGSSGDLRPGPGAAVGREDLPPGGVGGPADHRLGDVVLQRTGGRRGGLFRLAAGGGGLGFAPASASDGPRSTSSRSWKGSSSGPR